MFFQACNSGSEYSGTKDCHVAHLNSLSTIVPQPSLLCLAPVKNQANYTSNNKIKLSSNCKQTTPNAKKYQPILNNIKTGTNLPSNYENPIKFDKYIQNSLYIVKSQNTLVNNKMGVKLFLPNQKNERSLLAQPVINKAFNISNMPMTQKTANIMSYLKPVILTKPLTKLDQSNHPIYVTYIPNSLSSNNPSPIILSYISKPQHTSVKNSITTNQKNISPKCPVVTSNESKRTPNIISTSSKVNLLKNSLLFADYDSLDDMDEEIFKNQEGETCLSYSASTKDGKKSVGKKVLYKQAEKHTLNENHMNILNLLAKLSPEPNNTLSNLKHNELLECSTRDMSSKVSLDLLCKNYNNECQKKPCIFTSFNQSSGENRIQYCSRYALPYSNHCSIHIAAHPHQRLFERCSAKFSNNFQCIKPAFDPINDVPLCWQHSRKKAHHDLTLEKNQKISSFAASGTSKRPAKMSQTLLVLEKGETVLRDLHALILPSHQGSTDKSVSSNASNSKTNAHPSPDQNKIENVDGNHQRNQPQQFIRGNSSISCVGNNLISRQNDTIDVNIAKESSAHNNSARAGLGKANKRERKRRPATSKKTAVSLPVAPNSSKRGKMTSRYPVLQSDNSFTNAILTNHASNIAEVNCLYSQGKKNSAPNNILCSQVGMTGTNNRYKPPPSMFGHNDPFLSGSNNFFNQQYSRKNGCYSNGPFNGNGIVFTNNNKRPPLTMSPLSNVTGENSHNSNDLLFNFSTDLLDKSFDTDTLNVATNMIIEDVDMKDLNKLSEETFNDIFQNIGKEGSLSLNHMEDSSSCHDSSLPTKEDEILMNQALSDLTKDITAPGPVSVDFESEIIRLIQANLMKDYQPPHPTSSFPILASTTANLLATTSFSSQTPIYPNNHHLLSSNLFSPPQTFLHSNTTTINSSSSQQAFSNHFPPLSSDCNQQLYFSDQHRQLTSRSASLPSVYDSLPSHPLSPHNFLINGLNISPISVGMMCKGDKNINSLPSVAHLLGPKTATCLPLSFTPHTA